MQEVTELTPEAQAQLAPAEAPKPVEISRKQLGQLRRMHLTVQHSTVNACGHKFVADAMPARNCSDCWYAYFKTSVDLEALRDDLTRRGIEAVTSDYGVKYVKAFKRFLQQELSHGSHFAQPESDNLGDAAAHDATPISVEGSAIAPITAESVCNTDGHCPCAHDDNKGLPSVVHLS